MTQKRVICDLPRKWLSIASGAICEFDIAVTSGPLRAKVLVFKDQKTLYGFWNKKLGKGGLGHRTRGAVNTLMRETMRIHEDGSESENVLHFDRRYFCVMGFVKKWLSMEIVTHESVHAAFCYARRMTRRPWASFREFDEEDICYPAGIIARKINNKLHNLRLYHTKG